MSETGSKSKVGIAEDSEDESRDGLLAWLLMLQFSLTCETKEGVMVIVSYCK